MFLSVLGAVIVMASSIGAATETPRSQAAKLFQRLTGTPILNSDPRLLQMEKLVSDGKLLEAAAIATDDEKFLRITVKNMASVMSSKAETPYEEFNDFQALIVGVTRDELDARTLLTGDMAYRGAGGLGLDNVSETDNNHYAQIEQKRINLKTQLIKVTPQRTGFREASGLLTTRAWAAAHYVAGTNRRAVEYTFREFMCTPIQRWRDTGISDHRIRRDVDRGPGGNPATFKQECLLCHAPMDAMAGAFARLDFANEAIVHTGFEQIARKFNQNGTVYSEGYFTVDDSWINYATQNQNEAFGWTGNHSGYGVKAFGTMISNSEGFRSCMVRRAYKEVCRKDLVSKDRDLIDTLSGRFRDSGFKLKKLFQEVAVSSSCLSAPAANQVSQSETSLMEGYYEE